MLSRVIASWADKGLGVCVAVAHSGPATGAGTGGAALATGLGPFWASYIAKLAANAAAPAEPEGSGGAGYGGDGIMSSISSQDSDEEL